jgi:hypothetical protein
LTVPLPAIAAVAVLAAAAELSRRGSAAISAEKLEELVSAARSKSKAGQAPRRRGPVPGPSAPLTPSQIVSEQGLHPLLRDNLDAVQMHRCVLAVYEEQTSDALPPHERLSRAFAICTASLQRAGFLVGRQPTDAGRVRSREKAREPGALDRERRYQELLALSKESRRRAREQAKRAPAPSALEVELRGLRRGAVNRVGGKAKSWSKSDLQAEILQIREAMDPVFSCSTVWGDCKEDAPSAGHCFMASVALQDMLGGKILFGSVKFDDGDVSHYWNKIGRLEVDVTGDQFREPDVQIGKQVRPHIAPFERERYEWLPQDYNEKPMQIYNRFRKRLAKELDKQGREDLSSHLMHMQKP